MPIAIRRAVPQDAQAITDIIAAAFHEEANPAQIATLISEGEHLTLVAEDEQILGFIDGFYTLGKWDLLRLELDLLAVHPEHSGKGIGKALIKKFTDSQENAACIRALVAVNNTPMHHAMRATGYQQSDKLSNLYISSDGIANPKKIKNLPLIPVKTFTYTGIWIEALPKKEFIEAAHFLRQKLNYDIVGMVMDFPNSSIAEARSKYIKKACGLEFVKQFNWWKHQLISNDELDAHIMKWAEEND